MQQAAGVAQESVRDHLDPIKRTEPPQAEHPPVQDEQPAVAEHAHLALELVREVGRHLLQRDRAGRVDGAEAALDHEVREGQVVAEARVDLLVALAAHRVDGAVAARDRVDERLARPQPDLVAPVGALLVGALGRAQLQAAADVGHALVGQRGHELCERIGLPLAVGVRERDHIHVAERAHGVVLGVDLAAARSAHELDAAVGEARSRSRPCRSLEASEATTMRSSSGG